MSGFPCVISQGENEVVLNVCPYLASLSQLSFLFASRKVKKGLGLTDVRTCLSPDSCHLFFLTRAFCFS